MTDTTESFLAMFEFSSDSSGGIACDFKGEIRSFVFVPQVDDLSGVTMPEVHLEVEDFLIQDQAGDEDDEEENLTKLRKKKRMQSNRESAKRSRLKKQIQLEETTQLLEHLRQQNGLLRYKVSLAVNEYRELMLRNRELRMNAHNLSYRLQYLDLAASSLSINTTTAAPVAAVSSPATASAAAAAAAAASAWISERKLSSRE
ncbi:basic leucine zipper 43 isoform X2 [Selaginella moellendorffii]|uniref:basic leucine zipper 43 isoform X2 n=1 Tax=Selaginella moellendorffii TaxID=88036 RepID=UPI000D1CC1D1|nr:basic leucine zipper 43 isoform X2 [Selaginella moellendorffii]|eukprot:XP_024534090.1 basic leucine zipper 43 isoform X2 [Selaginella moellendorffii]